MAHLRCTAVRDGHQCQHDVDHSGKHYALAPNEAQPSKKRSIKWSDEETTHLALAEGEQIPVKTAMDAVRSHRMYILEVSKIALQLGISYEEAERLVQAEKAKYLATQEASDV